MPTKVVRSREIGAAAPLVSCITPTWNRHDKLAQLVSVFLSQTHEPKELLIYDDSEQPWTPPTDPRVRYWHSPTRLTIGAKRNFLTQQARGEIIAAFDDDDIYAPEWLTKCVEWLRDHDFVKLAVMRMRRESDGSEWRWDTTRCGDDCYALTGDGMAEGPLPADKDEAACDTALWGYGFSYAYRKAVALAEPFADMSLGEDYEFACRVRQKFKCKLVTDAEHLISHTLHPRSSSFVFPQTKLGASVGGVTPLPKDQPIQLEPGRHYEGVALLRGSHTLGDLKAKIAARGIELDTLEETATPSGEPEPPKGYRYVKFSGVASKSAELPWELPKPWRYRDKTRFVQIGASAADDPDVVIVRIGAGARTKQTDEEIGRKGGERQSEPVAGYGDAIFGTLEPRGRVGSGSPQDMLANYGLSQQAVGNYALSEAATMTGIPEASILNVLGAIESGDPAQIGQAAIDATLTTVYVAAASTPGVGTAVAAVGAALLLLQWVAGSSQPPPPPPPCSVECDPSNPNCNIGDTWWHGDPSNALLCGWAPGDIQAGSFEEYMGNALMGIYAKWMSLAPPGSLQPNDASGKGVPDLCWVVQQQHADPRQYAVAQMAAAFPALLLAWNSTHAPASAVLQKYPHAIGLNGPRTYVLTAPKSGSSPWATYEEDCDPIKATLKAYARAANVAYVNGQARITLNVNSVFTYKYLGMKPPPVNIPHLKPIKLGGKPSAASSVHPIAAVAIGAVATAALAAGGVGVWALLTQQAYGEAWSRILKKVFSESEASGTLLSRSGPKLFLPR